MSDLSTRRRLAGSIKPGAIHGSTSQPVRRRELALFNMAIDSKLRACDLVKLRVRDVCHGESVASRAIVLQQKKVTAGKNHGPTYDIRLPDFRSLGRDRLRSCNL